MTPALIGREHPAGVLRAEIGRATDSHGGLVLVTGEAGIGKTTLVTQAAHEARRRGALVLGGSCWDSDSAPGYWPWVQVVRALRRAAHEEEWAQAESAAGGRLAVLLGEGAGGAGAGGGSPGGDDDKEPFAVYDAVTTALVTVSQRRPVMVVLDDLHWSDPASLRLLEFAAQHAWFERLLLVGTYRDAEVETPDHPLQPLILPLAARATTTVTLTGLERDEVGALMALTAGREPEPSLVDEVHRRTGGNPFFVEQTARLWHSGSPPTAIPPGVREAVRRRLIMLPEPVGTLLITCAVLGREFHRQVLAAVTGAPVPHVDRLLERAVTARLVTAGESGLFSFAHDLVRETLYDALDEADVRRRHGAVVRALDGDPGPSSGRILPGDLARHAYLAGDELPAERRIELLVAAGRDASSRLAAEESVGHYRRALEVAEAGGAAAAAPGRDEAERLLLRRAALIALDLGSELHHAGADTESWAYLDRAAALADRLGEAELLARVAITLHSYGSVADGGRRGLTEVRLREAYRRLIGGGGSDRDALTPEQIAQDLAEQYAELARREEDDEALAFSLWARHDAIWGLGTSRERLTLTDEMAAMARRTKDVDMEFHSTAMRWVALLELGDPRYLDELRTSQAVGERRKLRRYELGMAVDKCLVAALMGRFTEAEDQLAGIGLIGNEYAQFAFVGLHVEWGLRLLQGRRDEVADVLARLDASGHPYPGLLEGITAAERGDRALALRLVAELEGRHEPFPRMFAPLWMRLRAQAAVLSGDKDLIASARSAFEPYRGQWVVSLFGCDISGPVDLWLGLLDAAEGRWAEAIEELDAAAASADRLRARPWALRARVSLAAALRSRGTAADLAREAALTAEVEREAKSLGLPDTSARQALGAQALGAQAPGSWNSGAQASASQASASQTSGPQSPGPQSPGLQASGPQSPGPPTSGPQVSGTQVSGAQTPGTPASGPQVSGARVSGARVSGAQTPGPQGSEPQTSGPQVSGPQTPGPQPDAAGRAEFRRDGAVWVLAFGGRTVHVPDAKGLRDLAVLLARPGTDVPAARLLAPGADPQQFGGDPVLDEEAKTRYRRRLDRLDDEIDRATASGDDARAAAYDRERQALLHELRTAAGLGGRPRRLGDEAERARKTVTARIRDTLRRLTPLHPELAAHLRESVSTGSSCGYHPAPPQPSWRL
ncbi:AAA family ATPase [Streptomyces sp. NPDC000410]|uniref:AAA family ATPase n=1 Tax=Streptomyces sp. NPDC000410 TaxID=3154254 RepID=UPI003328DAD3